MIIEYPMGLYHPTQLYHNVTSPTIWYSAVSEIAAITAGIPPYILYDVFPPPPRFRPTIRIK